MRVIAGKCRSLPLKAPKGMDTRPTQDRIKETLFNMLQNDIPQCIFIDLFAGSGGIGIEALSRGASKAYFVEHGKEAFSCIEENLKFTKLDTYAKCIKGDVFSALHMINEDTVDIIFADPPYNEGVEDRLLNSLNGLKYVSDDTIIIIEALIDNEIESEYFEVIKEKKYKTNKHVFLRRKNG